MEKILHCVAFDYYLITLFSAGFEHRFSRSNICFAFDHAGFSESNSITVYILGVLVTAVWTEGYGYGAMASLLSVAAFNFFFTVPRFTFQANDPSYPVTFFIMLLSSFLASSLAARVKAQARLAAEKGYYTELLLESSQK